jgi:two-component system, chemotaxis family, sensor kinase CheA
MNIDEEMKKALSTFIIESLELLQEMETNLLQIEDDEDYSERLNAIFRAAHTIKGSSGLFGLGHIVRFTHIVESLLDNLRDGKLSLSNQLVAVLLPCCDHMTLLINAVAEGSIDEDPELTESGNQLLSQLNPFLDNGNLKQIAKFPEGPEQIEAITGHIEIGNWHLSLRFGPDSLRNGMDPLSFIRYLSTLGEVVQITTIINGIPDAFDFRGSCPDNNDNQRYS